MLETLFLIVAAVVEILIAVQIVVLTFERVAQWFRARQSVVQQKDRERVAFSIKERLASGRFGMVQGIFDQRTEEIVDAQRVDAATADRKLEDAHAKEELVIYR